MNAKRFVGIIGGAALWSGVVGCGATQAPPVQQPASLDVPVAPGESTFVAQWPIQEGFVIDTVRDRAKKARIGLNITKEIHRRCALAEPRFAFDATALSAEDEAEIERLSRCFSSGPLKDRSLELIGRADQRGDPGYNMALGRRRAEQVKRLLVKGGVAPYRIEVVTRGAMQAVAEVEGYTHEDDRRVDIVLR